MNHLMARVGIFDALTQRILAFHVKDVKEKRPRGCMHAGIEE